MGQNCLKKKNPFEYIVPPPQVGRNNKILVKFSLWKLDILGNWPRKQKLHALENNNDKQAIDIGNDIKSRQIK